MISVWLQALVIAIFVAIASSPDVYANAVCKIILDAQDLPVAEHPEGRKSALLTAQAIELLAVKKSQGVTQIESVAFAKEVDASTFIPTLSEVNRIFHSQFSSLNLAKTPVVEAGDAALKALSKIFKDFYSKKLKEISNFIQSAEQKNTLSYYDLHRIGLEYVIFSEWEEAWDMVLSPFTQHRKNPQYPFPEIKSTEDLARFFDERIQSEMRTSLSDFPYFVNIPTFRSFNLHKMNQFAGAPIGPYGLLRPEDSPASVDGTRFRIFQFYSHDRNAHNFDIHKRVLEQLVIKIDPLVSREEYDFAQRWIRGASPAQLRAYNQEWVRFNQTFYPGILRKTAHFTARQKEIVVGLFFAFHHEWGSGDYTAQRWMELLKRDVRDGDIEQRFPSEEFSPNPGEVTEVVNKLFKIFN